MNGWLALSIAIVAEVIATSALNMSNGMSRWLPASIVVAGYATAFWFLGQCLKTIPVGIAYGVWAGVGIVLIALIGWIVFKQALDMAAMLGIGLIISGVVVIQVFSDMTER